MSNFIWKNEKFAVAFNVFKSEFKMQILRLVPLLHSWKFYWIDRHFSDDKIIQLCIFICLQITNIRQKYISPLVKKNEMRSCHMRRNGKSIITPLNKTGEKDEIDENISHRSIYFACSLLLFFLFFYFSSGWTLKWLL